MSTNRTLRDLLTSLAYGNLAGTHLVDENNTENIADEHLGRVVHFINDGLTKLYKKFILDRKEVLIHTFPTRSHYRIHSDYSRGGLTVPDQDHFILDSLAVPFVDDIVTILDVFQSTGIRLAVDDRQDPYSVHTINHDTLQITGGNLENQILSIICQIYYPKLDKNNLDTVLTYPLFIEETLEHFVAYKLFGSMNGAEHLQRAQEHEASFESNCSEIELKDLHRETFVTSHTKLDDRGFESWFLQQPQPTLY